jgi:hypothetical protein
MPNSAGATTLARRDVVRRALTAVATVAAGSVALTGAV